jgi:ATP-dependent Clp protease adaptor protein ClpS
MSQKQSKRKRGRYQVILNNDNVNTFDHVIDCLIEICGHNYYQAVQCATLTHGVKRCSVYVDNYESCENIYEELLSEGLDVIIEKHINHV